MLQISEVRIISVDKHDGVWAIEGEILFEQDLGLAFFVSYDENHDEFDELELEMNPGKYDECVLKDMVLKAAQEFDE